MKSSSRIRAAAWDEKLCIWTTIRTSRERWHRAWSSFLHVTSIVDRAKAGEVECRTYSCVHLDSAQDLLLGMAALGSIFVPAYDQERSDVPLGHLLRVSLLGS